MDILTRISKAKTGLILEHPFVGTIALNMATEISERVPTAATNGKRIIYNPKFVESLSDEEVKFLVAHECFHPMLEHIYRLKGRNARKWNKAGDYVINKLLTDEKIGKFIQGGLLSDSIYAAGGGTTDGIYNILPDEDGAGNGDYGIGDDLEEAEGSEAEQAQQQAEWKVKVAQAAQAAKMMGKLSANMERFVGEFLNPKVDWRDVLSRFLTKCKDDTRSFARPNRRFLSQGLYLPTSTGERLGRVAVYVDCSGSIGDREISEFAAEIRAIHEDMRPEALHVGYFDAEVSHLDVFTPDDSVVVTPHGGGGTAFSPIFRHIEEQGINPVACVVLTDLCCNDFGPAPDYPVLWVSNHSDAAPWGEVVKM